MSRLISLIIFLLFSIIIISFLDLTVAVKEIKASKKMRSFKKAGLIFPKNTLSRRIVKVSKKIKYLIKDSKISILGYYLVTIFAVISGMLIGKIFFKATLFVILVGIMGSFAPLLFLQIQKNKVKSKQIEKLRSSMMILSSSFIVTEDIVKSIEDNIDLLEYRKPFSDFLTYLLYIDGNVVVALRRLENMVDNSYFSQWIDVLIMAQDDRSLKYVTMSIIESMNDVAQVQIEADTIIYTVWREYFLVLALIFSTPIIFKVLMPKAYIILVSSFIGQSLLVLLLIAVIFSVLKALKINKPILM